MEGPLSFSTTGFVLSRLCLEAAAVSEDNLLVFFESAAVFLDLGELRARDEAGGRCCGLCLESSSEDSKTRPSSKISIVRGWPMMGLLVNLLINEMYGT